MFSSCRSFLSSSAITSSSARSMTPSWARFLTGNWLLLIISRSERPVDENWNEFKDAGKDAAGLSPPPIGGIGGSPDL